MGLSKADKERAEENWNDPEHDFAYRSLSARG